MAAAAVGDDRYGSSEARWTEVKEAKRTGQRHRGTRPASYDRLATYVEFKVLLF